mmetsp:Transcript_3046/g.4674  ORF Transcript_3046/g.4674 Transcript_3046/m.4674 type:complete len:84 (+) Transcript_3046:57-308(+)
MSHHEANWVPQKLKLRFHTLDTRLRKYRRFLLGRPHDKFGSTLRKSPCPDVRQPTVVTANFAVAFHPLPLEKEQANYLVLQSR